MQETAQLTFLEYAFPVLGYCNDVKISPWEILSYEETLKYGGDVKIERLTELFPNAVEHLESWDIDAVRHYWLIEHNKIIGNNYFCGVYVSRVGRVKEPKRNERCVVNLEGMGNRDFDSYVELNRGDIVSTHIFTVAERLLPPIIRKYFPERFDKI